MKQVFSTRFQLVICLFSFYWAFSVHAVRGQQNIPYDTEGMGSRSRNEEKRNLDITLNDLKITIDKQTGNIVGLAYPGPGKILDVQTGMGGLIDLAYPIPEFDALRLASGFSNEVRIERKVDTIVISWDNLGPSRSCFSLEGKVSATVWIMAMPDGKSISMKCRVENHSELPVSQVLFPDMQGLIPFAGREGTKLRTAGFVRKPFVDIAATSYPEFYALDDKFRSVDTWDTYEYRGGEGLRKGDEMIGRWLDFGGLNGGISMFPKAWVGSPYTIVRIFRQENDPTIRLAHVHANMIRKGETWESPEYVITPHANGWAKGIQPYRDFVEAQVDRLFPIPDHIRKGLGFRTIFMSKRAKEDGERDVVFKFTDLPRIARECKENGLNEIVAWAWRESFTNFPGDGPQSNLGTSEELSHAIKECNKMGVNVSLFVSLVTISEASADRYGLKVKNQSWNYHPEMIPRFDPTYATKYKSTLARVNDPRWQKDVLTDVQKIYKNFTHSICWDQAYMGTEDVFKQFLPWVKTNDPTATFSGEIPNSVELSSNYLDYTWNWELGSYHHNLMTSYRDLRAFNASFRAPRLNYNINRNAQHIKYAFMDNSYVNIMPSQQDNINGSAWISDYPEIGHVLKQCAHVREQFLEYFTDGELIGECLLSEECPSAHINAYVLPDRVFFMVMNTADTYREIDFKVDLEPWLKSKTGEYEVRRYDQYGTKFGNGLTIDHQWWGKTQHLRSMDFAIFEFIAI